MVFFFNLAGFAIFVAGFDCWWLPSLNRKTVAGV
jgi:hypothetical protein